MEDWQESVIDEKAELDKKIKALAEAAIPRDMPETKYALLREQFEAMTKYSCILNSRIGNF